MLTDRTQSFKLADRAYETLGPRRADDRLVPIVRLRLDLLRGHRIVRRAAHRLRMMLQACTPPSPLDIAGSEPAGAEAGAGNDGGQRIEDVLFGLGRYLRWQILSERACDVFGQPYGFG